MQGWGIKEIPHKPVITGTIARQRRDKRRILADCGVLSERSESPCEVARGSPPENRAVASPAVSKEERSP